MTAEVIRLTEASEAIGAPPRTVKAWFERHDLDPAVAGAGRWKTFGYGQIAVFALTNVLMKAGFITPLAFALSRQIVHTRYPGLFKGQSVWKVSGLGLEHLVLRDGTWAWLIDGYDPTEPDTPVDALLVLSAAQIIEAAFSKLRRNHNDVPVRIDVRTGKKKR
jgi:hypothetical protein